MKWCLLVCVAFALLMACALTYLALSFPFLLAVCNGGNDGELCIWRSKDWECLLRMKGHKGAVHDVSVHPSGRLALSVAADRKLMLWNLLTGKCNYTLALPAAEAAFYARE